MITVSFDGMRWGDLYRIVDLAREADVPPHHDVEFVFDDNGAIGLALPPPAP